MAWHTHTKKKKKKQQTGQDTTEQAHKRKQIQPVTENLYHSSRSRAGSSSTEAGRQQRLWCGCWHRSGWRLRPGRLAIAHYRPRPPPLPCVRAGRPRPRGGGNPPTPRDSPHRRTSVPHREGYHAASAWLRFASSRRRRLASSRRPLSLIVFPARDDRFNSSSPPSPTPSPPAGLHGGGGVDPCLFYARRR